MDSAIPNQGTSSNGLERGPGLLDISTSSSVRPASGFDEQLPHPAFDCDEGL